MSIYSSRRFTTPQLRRSAPTALLDRLEIADFPALFNQPNHFPHTIIDIYINNSYYHGVSGLVAAVPWKKRSIADGIVEGFA
jgi:hypothetical protein